MNEIFSDYVADLAREENPDVDRYEDVREELRTVVVAEMRRRGLWRAPPFYLGYTGSRWGEGALEDLLTDAYTFIFLRRLGGLRRQLRLKTDIRPMVLLNVRHFISHLQKKADPLGHRIYGRLREAVELLIDRREMFVLGEEPSETGFRLTSGTVLRFRLRMAPLSDRGLIEREARRLNDALLPELITAEGRAVPRVVERLAGQVRALADHEVEAFRFGDLLRELRGDVRRRWEGIWRTSLGELGAECQGERSPVLVPLVPPDDEPDWTRRLALIQECVVISIGAERCPKRRRDLKSLWVLLQSTRVIPGRIGPLPPFADLGRQLKLTRGRIRQLFELLEPIVRACLRVAGRPAVFEIRAAPRSREETSEVPAARRAGRRR